MSSPTPPAAALAGAIEPSSASPASIPVVTQPQLFESPSQGKTLLERYGEEGLLRLWAHQMNGNGPFDYVMGFRDKGKKTYTRARRVPIANGLRRAMTTVLGSAPAGRESTVAAYARNQSGMSCWGAFDFDYGPDGGRDARRPANAALAEITKENRYVVLEETHNGLHLVILKKDLIPSEAWTRFLTEIACSIGASIKRGVCEIFPSASSSNTNAGFALRLLGSWNPSAGRVGTILFENIAPLMSELEADPPPLLPSSYPKRDKCLPNSQDESESDDKNSTSSEDNQKKENNGGKITRKKSRKNNDQTAFEQKWASRYPINRPRQRNDRLKELTANIYFVVSRATGRDIAEEQFIKKTVKTEADLAAHIKDFEDIWDSMEKQVWLPSLNPVEVQTLERLNTPAERDAFRIIGGYARFAKKSGQDFFIVRDDLARRLQLSGPGAGKLVTRFITLNILKRTQEYIPEVSAARYRWLLNAETDAANDLHAKVSPASVTESAAVPSSSEEVNYGWAAPANLFERTLMRRYTDQILAHLSVDEMLSLEDLRQKIAGYKDNVALAERVMARLRLRLAIDVDPSGAIKLGPNHANYPIFRAMMILSKAVFGQLNDNPAALERLASHFSIDPAALVEARRRLLALGMLMRDDLNRLRPHPHSAGVI